MQYKLNGFPAPRCLLIEGCDFQSFPPGGQLATAKQLMTAFGPRLALVGLCDDEQTPVGHWIRREFSGRTFLFYGIGRVSRGARRPLLPARLTEAARLARHRTGVMSLGVRSALTRAPEDLLVISRWGLDSICYWFPGVANPLLAPRYAWGRLLADPFDRTLFAALGKTNAILASADESAIAALVARSRGRLTRDRIQQMFTHYDSAVFFPSDQGECRRKFGHSHSRPIVVASGRLNRVKGWDLVLAAFRVFRMSEPRAHLVFVGDGEDRESLTTAAANLGVQEHVTVTGFVAPSTVAEWLNAADLVVVGSHTEGWSVAMLEALACGKPIVSTAVSGADTLITPGANGFIVDSRSPEAFAEAMARALRLPAAHRTSLERAQQYDVASLAHRVGTAWSVLS